MRSGYRRPLFLFRIRNENGFRQLLRDCPKVPPILNARFAEVK